MAERNGYLVIYRNDLNRGIERFPEKVEAIIFAKTEQYRLVVENYAKSNAPWTDRTSNARNTLSARTEHSPGRDSIILQHGMPYGIWLEVRNAGRYAIVIPTIKYQGPRLMKSLEHILDRLDNS